MVDDENAPGIELFIVEYGDDSGETETSREALARELADVYNLSADAYEAMMADIEAYPMCTLDTSTVEFETNGRRGFFAVSDDYWQYFLIEASAPVELFDQYAEMLRNSVESLRTLEAACG